MFYMRMETDSDLKHCIRFLDFETLNDVQSPKSESFWMWFAMIKTKQNWMLHPFVVCQRLFHIRNGWFQSLTLFFEQKARM